jgi:hypothetical protein
LGGCIGYPGMEVLCFFLESEEVIGMDLTIESNTLIRDTLCPCLPSFVVVLVQTV